MIIYYNPHIDDFLGELPYFKARGRKSTKKYGFLITESLRQHGNISVLIDGTVSSFVPGKIFSKMPRALRTLISEIEFILWKSINGLSNKVVRINHAERNKRDDVLLIFSYNSATGKKLFTERMELLESFPIVVAHLSHYFMMTSEKSNNLRKLNNLWLAGDSDISGNNYFRHYFDWYQKDVLVLPFAVDHRFQSNTLFENRKDSCIATGTIINLDEERNTSRHKDFQSFFKVNVYHPVRRLIYDLPINQNILITSKINLVRGEVTSSPLKNWARKFSAAQKNYFRINFVEEYNSYKFAVIGEELSGFPALGSLEAMACGCALIAQPAYYRGLGLEANTHFIPHDGTIEGIASAIGRVQESGEISKAGKLLIETHFRPETVYMKWIATIGNLINH